MGKRCWVAGLVMWMAATAWATEHQRGEVFVSNRDKTERVTYFFYLPEGEIEQPVPVLVATDGVPSDGARFMEPQWKRFADENRIAVVSLGFTFDPEDWPIQRSYQYPRAWSGRALLAILEQIVAQHPIDPETLYLFGVSAGSQFSTRFALLYPERVKAVAAHAAGGYDMPRGFKPTQFLLTVGELDEGPDATRVSMAEVYTRSARRKGIDVDLRIIPGLAHRQTEEQDEMSRQFFLERAPH